jgi:hypothetical protein
MNESIPADGDDFAADQLDRFIDGLMSDIEAEEFLASCEDPNLAIAEREMQSKIDESLRRTLGFDEVEKEALVRVAKRGILTSQPVRRSLVDSLRESRLFKLAIAASLLFIIGISGWMIGGFGRNVSPHFQSRSLAMIYNETTERGFRPYYNCEDDQRFADTFEFRQGTPLALAELPEGSRMLGLSYLGGISRNTTAMLAEVDGKAVMVFVDTDANGRELDVVTANDDSDLNVFVVERDGLIFCEVTPHETAELIQYFEVVE